jgi:hypothetical protein
MSSTQFVAFCSPLPSGEGPGVRVRTPARSALIAMPANRSWQVAPNDARWNRSTPHLPSPQPLSRGERGFLLIARLAARDGARR